MNLLLLWASPAGLAFAAAAVEFPSIAYPAEILAVPLPYLAAATEILAVDFPSIAVAIGYRPGAVADLLMAATAEEWGAGFDS